MPPKQYHQSRQAEEGEGGGLGHRQDLPAKLAVGKLRGRDVHIPQAAFELIDLRVGKRKGIGTKGRGSRTKEEIFRRVPRTAAPFKCGTTQIENDGRIGS